MPIRYITGSLFDAPDGSILVHACNCQGSWGAGIAAAFRKLFPESYEEHKQYCRRSAAEQLLGTTQLIKTSQGFTIACLFTSSSFGGRVDPPEAILKATRDGLLDMQRQLQGSHPNIAGCKFNSGLFRVPWSETEKVIDDLKIDMTIYSPA